MKWLYLLLDAGTLFFPLVLSFDKRVAFVKSWKYVLIACLAVGVPFLIWDIFFTAKGFWGFNEDYLVGVYLGNLPIEEVSFFIVVPFACTFIYACVKAYFGHINFEKLNKFFLIFISVYIIFIAAFGYSGAYSISVIITSIITLIIYLRYKNELHFLPVSFFIVLIPFLIVNGVLTGAVTPEPIVWYNDTERTPFRIISIPVEDVLYGFTLVALNIVVFQKLLLKNQKS